MSSKFYPDPPSVPDISHANSSYVPRFVHPSRRLTCAPDCIQKGIASAKSIQRPISPQTVISVDEFCERPKHPPLSSRALSQSKWLEGENENNNFLQSPSDEVSYSHRLPLNSAHSPPQISFSTIKYKSEKFLNTNGSSYSPSYIHPLISPPSDRTSITKESEKTDSKRSIMRCARISPKSFNSAIKEYNNNNNNNNQMRVEFNSNSVLRRAGGSISNT